MEREIEREREKERRKTLFHFFSFFFFFVFAFPSIELEQDGMLIDRVLPSSPSSFALFFPPDGSITSSLTPYLPFQKPNQKNRPAVPRTTSLPSRRRTTRPTSTRGTSPTSRTMTTMTPPTTTTVTPQRERRPPEIPRART